MYVYKELQHRDDPVAYFGMPMNLDNEGMIEGTRDLCHMTPKLDSPPSPNCKQMTKTFYLQYQWLPFLIGGLALLYFIPYLVFLHGNRDLRKLKDLVKSSEDPNLPKTIAKNFFHVYNPRMNPNRFLFLHILANLFSKLLYVVAHVVSVLSLNFVLNNDYIWYGIKWLQWTQLDNSAAYDYMGARETPKPGNVLLPPFGYCEMIESAKDVKISLSNRHKFVCELSQHVLYQYCLFVLWLAIALGIVVTFFGIIQCLLHYVFLAISGSCGRLTSRKLSKKIRFREVEYLDYLRQKDVGLLEEVMEVLEDRLEQRSPPTSTSTSNDSLVKPPNQYY